MFKGFGESSKEVIFGKKIHPLADVHRRAGFTLGREQWDDQDARSRSCSRADFTKPNILFGKEQMVRRNRSLMTLNQDISDPDIQRKTEFIDQYRGQQTIKQACFPRPEVQVNLGDVTGEFTTQSGDTHQWLSHQWAGANHGHRAGYLERHITGEIANAHAKEPWKSGRLVARTPWEQAQPGGIHDPILGVKKPRPMVDTSIPRELPSRKAFFAGKRM